VQATILKIMDELGDNPSGSKANEELILETGEPRIRCLHAIIAIAYRPIASMGLRRPGLSCRKLLLDAYWGQRGAALAQGRLPGLAEPLARYSFRSATIDAD
jgi:hypothetical protein